MDVDQRRWLEAMSFEISVIWKSEKVLQHPINIRHQDRRLRDHSCPKLKDVPFCSV